MTGFFYFYSFTLTLEVSVTSGNNKTNVLSDMLSDSIKYKDLRSETHT